MPMRALMVCLAAFLLGSIPWGYLLFRFRTGGDIRQRGSGNIGATNVLRNAGRGLGLLTLLLDAAKGYAAVWLAREAAVSWNVVAAAVVLVIAGHLFTPWLGFQGGKGVATGLGAFFCLAPAAMGVGIVVWLLVAAAWRFVSLASIVTSAVLPFLIAWRYGRIFPVSIYAAAAVTAALIIWRHHTNLGRLRRGAEPRLFQRTAS